MQVTFAAPDDYIPNKLAMKLSRIEAASEKFRRLRRSLTLGMAGLILGMLFVPPAGASVIPSGATVDYHPVADTILDLTDVGAVEFRRVVIDAGITLRILLPADGAYAQIVAVDDIVLNGIVDAGSGSLDLAAGTRIVMGPGARLSGENISFQTGNLNLDGMIDIAMAPSSTFMTHEDFVTLSPSISLVTNNFLIYPDASITILAPAPVPEPATWLLLLTGLALLVQHDLRRNRRVR